METRRQGAKDFKRFSLLLPVCKRKQETIYHGRIILHQGAGIEKTAPGYCRFSFFGMTI